jgi:transposase
MPKPVPVPIRQKLWERSQQGEGSASLAAAFDLCPRTVRHLLKRFRDRGEAGLATDYRPPPRPAHAKPEAIRQAVTAKRLEHPSWGAGLIRVALVQERPEVAWPGVRTMQKWLRQAGLGPAPPGRRPGRTRDRAGRPHQTWQIDACEQIGLKGDQKVSWLRVVDEATGAVLGTTVFPPRLLDPGRPPPDPGQLASAVPGVGPSRGAAGR